MGSSWSSEQRKDSVGLPPLADGEMLLMRLEASIDAVIVDDNPVNVKVLQMFLKRISGIHTVLAAENGIVALEMLLKRLRSQQMRRPLLVLMDVQMPLLDGNQAARLWRNLEKEARVPPAYIIAMTAGSEACIELALFDGHVPKPIKYEHVLNLISKMEARK